MFGFLSTCCPTSSVLFSNIRFSITGFSFSLHMFNSKQPKKIDYQKTRSQILICIEKNGNINGIGEIQKHKVRDLWKKWRPSDHFQKQRLVYEKCWFKAWRFMILVHPLSMFQSRLKDSRYYRLKPVWQWSLLNEIRYCPWWWPASNWNLNGFHLIQNRLFQQVWSLFAQMFCLPQFLGQKLTLKIRKQSNTRKLKL